MKRIFTRINIIRLALFMGAVVAIILSLPHNSSKSYSFEVNQPWRYPLLTAPFDIPVIPDSATIKGLKDSIDLKFTPFIKIEQEVAEANIRNFRQAAKQSGKQININWITAAMNLVYGRGIVDNTIADRIASGDITSVRTTENGDGDNSISTINAKKFLSSRAAFMLIDSLYQVSMPNATIKLSETGLSDFLDPNYVTDNEANTKYRDLEYLNVTGAQGIIKQGQRIVDRGEIITPQIYTNLLTYEEMMLKRQDASQFENLNFIGQALFIVIVLLLFYIYIATYRPRLFGNIRKITFLMIFLTFFCVLANIMFDNLRYGTFITPFAALPVVILVFFDSRTAVFSLISAILICSLSATYQFQFIFIELVVGLVATFSITQLSRRSQLLRTAFFSFIAYCVAYTVSILTMEGSLDNFQVRSVGLYAINTIILSFAYVLIFLIEKIFGFTSTVTLVELSDINNPLLRKLAEEAPGTFQHSMQVSTLAAEAARAIGANTQLVRTGALYHDIGKMESPIFFTENQHGVNPHDGLDPETSARKIISHVTEGLQKASKEKLPIVIRDFIAEHHGKGVTRYFYATACKEAGDGEMPDPTPYTYPGPNPQSKETSILMMADSIEAASRSLKEYSWNTIDNLVEKIVDSQIAAGLFKESPISIRDIEKVKMTFKKRLTTIYHSRVEYPDMKS